MSEVALGKRQRCPQINQMDADCREEDDDGAGRSQLRKRRTCQGNLAMMGPGIDSDFHHPVVSICVNLRDLRAAAFRVGMADEGVGPTRDERKGDITASVKGTSLIVENRREERVRSASD